MKKVVLAYSGGLDTSCIVRWLKDRGFEVVAFLADLGQQGNLDLLRRRALETGASKVYIEDLKSEFIQDFIFPAIKANALYEGKYLLATALGRPLIAKTLVKIAREEAVSFLVENQRPEGSWISSFEVWGVTDTVSPLRDGKTALCALGLLGCKGDSKASKAVSRALNFLLKSHEARKKKKEKEYYMDYMPWSDTCMLMFFSKCLSYNCFSLRHGTLDCTYNYYTSIDSTHSTCYIPSKVNMTWCVK